jgi:hypothetical protein
MVDQFYESANEPGNRQVALQPVSLVMARLGPLQCFSEADGNLTK